MESLTYDLDKACGGNLAILLNPDHACHADTLNTNCLTAKTTVWKDRQYLILRYDKNRLSEDNIGSSGLFRSVIACEGKIVSYSPPKSVSCDSYMKEAGMWDDTLLEEFIEGTMVNVFNVDGEWEIATRSMIGANGRFFNNEERIRSCLRFMTQCAPVVPL